MKKDALTYYVANSSLLRCALLVMTGCKARGQCNLRRNCEGVVIITSVRLLGAREGNMENLCESLIKIVMGNKLKTLKGLNQNGKG